VTLGARATPIARRVAAAHGLSLEDIVGTGPRGRITRRDVEPRAGTVAGPPPISAPAPAPAPAPASSAGSIKGTVELVELTRLQQTVARRMAEVKATVPEFQVQTEVAMDEAISLRTQIRESGIEVPSLNDLIVRAAALALREHPRANGSYRDGRFELYSRVNVGVAVAGPDALVVPTIFDADIKSLGTIAAEVRRAVERVRDGQITPPELSGGTFTVSNLGMYGMTAIYPVISAPQGGILGVGATRPVLARRDGDIVERQLMTLTLTCDHRILYGADAAAFLSAIKELLEQPLRVAV
jgi:pyruvate dehydrogenase E2 component (dihydrolipoamide acetyltransferase)